MGSSRAEQLAVAQQQLNDIETALKNVGSGVTSVTIDGVTTQLNRKGLLEEYEYWNKRVARLSRTGARARGIDLSGAHE